MALHVLFKILNPDYAALGQGPEYIRNYWDDVAQVITVSYQATKQLTGRMGGRSQYQFCDGTTLNAFYLNATYPYATRTQFPNSQFCVVLNVCDAHIQNPLVITDASSGLADGSVSIRGYTSKPFKIDGSITKVTEYSLDGVTWQASPYFSGLAAGNYTAYMKDVADCTDSRDFTIGTAPVYGLRFTTSYKDYLGTTTRIDIKKRYYDGVSNEVRASDTPLIIKERAEGMFTELRGQECTIGLLDLTQDQYIEMFTGDDREFKIEVYKGSSLFWTGWLVPDVYNAPYLAPPFPVSFSATDGLGELKNVPFTEGLPEGLMTQWDVLMHILRVNNIILPITSGINLYETRMDTRPEDEPLKQAVVSMDAYHDDETVKDCAEVLAAILRPYGAFIRQYNGAWHLVRVEELASSFVRRYYDEQGFYLSHETFFPNRLITTGSTASQAFYWIDNSQALELKPAYKNATVHVDYGLRDNVIKGGYFKASDFENGWHKYLSGSINPFQGVQDPKSDVYPVITGAVPSFSHLGDYFATDRVYVKKEPDMGLYFRIEFMITASEATANPTDIPPDFYYSLKINDLYYNGGTFNPWRVNGLKRRVQGPTVNTWQTVEFITANIPEDGWASVLVYYGVMNDYDFVNVQVRQIVLIPVRLVSPALAEDETFTAVNSRKQFFAPDVVESLHGDVLPQKNAPILYRNILLVNNGNDTSLDWQRRGKLEEKPILELLANTMLTLNETPVKVLRGKLKGVFGWDQVIQEPLVLTRYMPVGFEYDDRNNTISAEFMELLGTTQPAPTKRLLLETGNPILFEDNTYIGIEG